MATAKRAAETFNSGVLSVYSVGNAAKPGDMPKETLALKYGLIRYEERTVGVKRFFEWQQAGVSIDRVVRIQRLADVSPQDVVTLPDGRQYRIRQVQYTGNQIPCCDLSLERLETNYALSQGI